MSATRRRGTTGGQDQEIDVTPSDSGGVTKRILTEGSGEVPPHGSYVTVHYVGRLAGTTIKFDSSRDRNEPFSFQLGKGEVIKGWDLGVASMCVGEKCILRCAPEYAYGSRGAGNVIPPNATLEFEVELLSFSEKAPSSPYSLVIALVAVLALIVLLVVGIAVSSAEDATIITATKKH
eukprot:GEZU01022556.1.p1 GENE.GEZU01022556.1~~GEZU01022556.1.p1  ORF type:complete len:178 (-),score=35.51 GEZU01022556.1:58-591(-)